MPAENNDSHEPLINKIAKGDKEAMKELYEKYRKPVYMYALSIVRDSTIAEDVMQDVFVSIMQNSFASPIKNEKAWIFTIARNRAIQVSEKEKREKDLLLINEETRLEYYDERDPLSEIEALTILNSFERQIVVLYIYCGFSQKEIAKITNRPYISIRSKYGYAIRKLKRFYEERGITDEG